jgi:hypothetical protein
MAADQSHPTRRTKAPLLATALPALICFVRQAFLPKSRCRRGAARLFNLAVQFLIPAINFSNRFIIFVVIQIEMRFFEREFACTSLGSNQ